MNSRRLMAIVAAGASGFLTLIQSGDRPDRYGRPPRMLPSVIGGPCGCFGLVALRSTKMLR